MLLENRLGLVTGAGRGLGAAIALAIARAGGRVIVTDVAPDLVEASVAAIRAEGHEAWGHVLDVSDAQACLALAETVRREQGAISMLVNNAGVGGEAPLDDPRVLDIWNRQLAVNLSGPFFVTRAFVGALRETRGAVVNLASMASFHAVTLGHAYMASKAGVKLLTQSLAKELASDGIRVNAVAPGVINTDMTARRRQDASWMEPVLSRIPMKRTGDPDEVADPVVFLLSPMARYVTGATLPIDGGFLAI